MSKKIALIFNGVWSQYSFAKASKHKSFYELVYIHDLCQASLADKEAVAIPFQSNHLAIANKKELLFDFLAKGKKIFVEGDSSANWLDAKWEDRPVNNHWWVTDPNHPPISETDHNHPIYKDLSPRHSFWHYHGVYTKVPKEAHIIQKDQAGDIVTWETEKYGGKLLVTTLDPIVEHGIQQITHLDNYCDRLTEWLIGEKPTGPFIIEKEDYGIAL